MESLAGHRWSEFRVVPDNKRGVRFGIRCNVLAAAGFVRQKGDIGGVSDLTNRRHFPHRIPTPSIVDHITIAGKPWSPSTFALYDHMAQQLPFWWPDIVAGFHHSDALARHTESGLDKAEITRKFIAEGTRGDGSQLL